MPISIGIPFYNAESYLADAIRSVFSQTYQDWELLLVDDGSTDRSLEIARSIRDPRVRVLSDGQNKKLPFRLNQITSEAKYDFIGRMDADDLISPARFQKQIDFLNTHKEFDLITTGLCSINKKDTPIGVRCSSLGSSVNGKNLIMGRHGIVHASILGKKSWFKRNPYDSSVHLCEDYELWLRAFSKNDFNIYILNEPLYYYREDKTELAAGMIEAYRNQIKQIKKYYHIGFNRIQCELVVSKFYCKEFVVRILDFLDKTDLLIKKRNSPITDNDLLTHLKNDICRIKRVKLSF